MASVRSKLGENPPPKPGNQGDAGRSRITPSSTQKSNGNTAPRSDDRRNGVTPKPRGGSGTGSRKGDSLPR